MNEQYYQIDSAGMVVVKGDKNSWKDSIGNTLWGIIGQPEKKEEYLQTILGCIKITPNGKYKIFRHPDHFDDKTMSRDHFLNFINCMIETECKSILDYINRHLPWRISELHTHTIDSWLWCKGITGSKWAMWLWFRVSRITQWCNYKWNAYLYKKVPFSPEMNVHTYTMINLYRTNRQLKWREKLYPIYALQNFGWQLRATPKGHQKEILKKICLKITPRYNYLLKILFGGWVHYTSVQFYESCTSDRWGVPLNQANDRDTRKLTEEEKGNMDLEKYILKTMYRESSL